MPPVREERHRRDKGPGGREQNFYFVVHREGGIRKLCRSFRECLPELRGHANAICKKFDTLDRARQFFEEGPSDKDREAYAALKALPSGALPKAPSQSQRLKFAPAQRPAPSQDPADWFLTTEDFKPPETKSAQAPPDSKSGEVVVYTDGSCFGNGTDDAVGGCGVYWLDPAHHAHNLSVPLPVEGGRVASNNRAELMAAALAVECAAMGDRDIEVRTDSEYTTKSVGEWLEKWQRNGWKLSSGGDVKNRDIVERILAAVKARKGRVRWTWVRVHAAQIVFAVVFLCVLSRSANNIAVQLILVFLLPPLAWTSQGPSMS
jgi:ribonuclease HI